jgi:hypothetical protein
MKLIKLLKNINNLLVISIIDKIGVFNNFKTDDIIEMNFSFIYKKEKLNFSDETITNFPYLYIGIEYIYYIITSTQYYRHKLLIDKIGYIVFTKNNYPIITIKDKSQLYDKSLVIDINLFEQELLAHYREKKYWNIIYFNTFLNISVLSVVLYKKLIT